jgi:hypothetical protein
VSVVVVVTVVAAAATVVAESTYVTGWPSINVHWPRSEIALWIMSTLG